MEWQDKFQAIASLDGGASLKLRDDGTWYVSARIEIGGNGVLMTPCSTGKTPEEAVEDEWANLTTLEPEQYLVVNSFQPDRRHFRWNGFMWQSLPVRFEKPKAGAA